MQNQENINDPAKEAGDRDLANKNKKKSSFFQTIKKYPVVFTVLIAIIVIVGVYFWKEQEGITELERVEKMATTQLMQNNQDMLKIMAKPLIWSIRAEMLRGNMEQVNIFTTDLVREKNFQFIYVVEPGGDFIVSTDKKLEGQSAIGMFDARLVQTDSVLIDVGDNNVLTLAAPVMGYDKKLAILIMKYSPPKFVRDNGDMPKDSVVRN